MDQPVSPRSGSSPSLARPPCSSAPGSSRRDRKIAVFIFLGCLLVYHANGRNHSGVDTMPATYTAWSLLRHGSLDVGGYPELPHRFLLELPDGRWVSIRSPGAALMAVPFAAPLAIFREQPLSAVNMNHLGKLVSAIWLAAGVALFFLLCRRLVPEGAWPATVLLGLGTCLWSVASQALWGHGPATFWLCLALYVLLPASREVGVRRGCWGGLALGMAVFTRPTTAFFALATGLSLLLGRRWRALGGLVLGGALPVALYCLINYSCFGDPIRGGYLHDNWTMPTPLWLGVTGLLVAPSRGVLVYSPALLLLPLGLWALTRRAAGRVAAPERGLLLAWLGAAAVSLVFFARWHDWRGGWCYGPRFLCEAMPIACLLFALGYAALRAAWAHRLAWGLVGLSVAVHFIGVNGASGAGDWYVRHELPDQGRCLFALQDTQIEAWTRAMFQRHLQRLREAFGQPN
jgi:hypothetical protein